MIKLENVSTESLYYEPSIRYFENDYVNQSLLHNVLTKNEVNDYQRLKDLIESGDKVFNTPFFKNKLLRTEQDLEHANYLGHEPKLYKADGYDRFELDEETLKWLRDSDKRVNAGMLLYASPTTDYSVKKKILSSQTVYSVKQLLEHCVVSQTVYSGENALLHYLRWFGQTDAQKLLKAIAFYEEQVLRELKEVNNIPYPDIFESNYFSKLEIVESQVKELIEYFVDNAQMCVWGELTDAKKRILLNSLTKKGGENIVKYNFINAIVNYTTLSELEKDIVKTKTIDRFIKY